MTREEVYLSEGCFVSAYVGDATPREVAPRDVVLIPAACRQRIANTGAGDLVFLAICTPRFTYDAYEELEC